MNIQFKRYENTYKKEVEEIAVQAWTPIRASFKKELGESIYQCIFENWQESKKKVVVDELISAHGYVILIDDVVVGFFTFHYDEKTKMGEIGNNALSVDYKGKGIAQQAYGFIFQQLKALGAKIVSVTTGLDEGHIPARKAYEKAGFEVNLKSITYYKEI